VIEYSQYYDLFSRDSHGQAVNQGHENDNPRDENSQRSINIPDHLRMKTEQICLSTIQQEQQSRALIQEQEQTLKDELQRSIIDLKQSQTNNEERHLIREQQIRAVAEESNTRSPVTEPAHAMAE
jgi:nitrate/nitrite-specific signal transduction histidine kinase